MGFPDELNARYAAKKQQAELMSDIEAEGQRAARALVEDFVKTVREKGIHPVEVRTRSGHNVTYRTKLLGWEIGHGVCVGTDGEMYSLSVESGLFKDKSPRRLSTLPHWFHFMDDSTSLRDALWYFLIRDTKS